MTEPEVALRVRSGRRRKIEVPLPPARPTPNVRSWLIYIGLSTVVAALMQDGFLRHRPKGRALPNLAQATEVSSAVSQQAESLQVVISWDLTLSDSAGQPDSIRVKVLTDPLRDSLISLQPADQLADTLHLAAPPAGRTVTGLSCVAAEHPGELRQEACTPWQFVKPSATDETARGVGVRIVVQPAGLQVDPDVGGACARWQATHPQESVWIEVNRMAVPECTGPNHKPTVAQFCAFAVLPDGRMVKTANSANNAYCEELFEGWSRERLS